MQHPDMERTIVSREQIARRVREMGEQITRDYRGKDLTVVGILKGGVIFFADLIREIDLPVETDFMSISSYGANTQTSGYARILKDLNVPCEGKHLLIVEDIIDSGVTLSSLLKVLETRNPASIRICTLLDKPERRQIALKPEYVGFAVDNVFVVGYGLDYNERYRNWPEVGVLKPEIYMEK